ncbi:MAG: hypothetical protein QOD76_2205 [Solirubrobacteraceae bacterium]|jgi:DNA-binding CsgD family transcriptional regulator|nr:hypothetical protein [Solirubrobacteraceae bacterium]
MSQQLFDRDAELEEIGAQLEKARSGEGTLLAVEGPAGIGKTRLLAAARASASESGMEVLTARGSELEREFPFGVVRQLLERHVVEVDASQRARLLAGAATLAAPVLGLREATGDADGTPEPADPAFAAVHGLYWLFANIASERPLVAVVDDAHWADAASLRFMAYLLPRLPELPAAVLVATRPDEPTAERELLGRVGSDPLTNYVRPVPLGETAVGEIVLSRLGQQPDTAFARACRDATGGNPFLLNELLMALAADGCAPVAAEARRISELGPESIGRSLALRLSRLPEGAKELAQVVAVLGERCELRHAAALAGLDMDAAGAAADVLVSAGVLAAGRPLQFVHPIVRTSVYAELPEGARSRLHARSAELLEAESATPEAVAVHLLAVDPRGDGEVVATLIAAGEAAFRRGAPELAARYLERALEEPPSNEQRPTLLFALGKAESWSSDPAAVVHMTEALELSKNPEKRAEIAIDLAGAMVVADREREAVEILEQVISGLGEHPDLALRVEAELLTAAQLDVELIAFAGQRMMGLAEKVLPEKEDGDSLAERLILANLAFGAAASAMAPAEGTAAIALRAIGDDPLADESAWITMGLAGLALAYADRLAQALQRFDEAKDIARRSGSGLMFGMACCWRSNIAYRAGRLQDAEADARAAIGMGLSQWGEVGCEAAFLVDVLLERGELEEAEETLRRRNLLGEIPRLVHTSFILESRGRLRVSQRRLEEGLEDLLLCGHNLDAAGVKNPALAAWRSRAAAVHAQLGDTREALRLAREEVELARAFGAPRALGMALRGLGLVCKGEERLTHLGEAADALGDSQAPLERARTLADLGAALRREGRRRDARDPLRLAIDEATRCGAVELARHAEEELRATGARPRRLVLSGVAALTASERRIAEMAAKDLSNKEIAQSLFLTVRTVEMHLTSAYRKLDIKSRTDLPAALDEPALKPVSEAALGA